MVSNIYLQLGWIQNHIGEWSTPLGMSVYEGIPKITWERWEDSP